MAPVNFYRSSFNQYAGTTNVYNLGSAPPAAGGGDGGVNIVTRTLTHWFDAGHSSSYAGSGATWTNLSTGPNVNMALVNAPLYVSAGSSSYFVFNGVDEYTTSSRFLASGDRAFTLSMICNFAPLDTAFVQQRFWSDNGNPTSLRVYREFDTNRIVNMDFSQGATNFFGDIAYVPDGNIISASQNYMLTFVSNNTNLSMYINGTFYTASTEPFTTGTMTGGGTFWFAADGGASNIISMSIAHILFYSSSLSGSEVQQNYNVLKTRYGI